jgi:hypothetical protein
MNKTAAGEIIYCQNSAFPAFYAKYVCASILLQTIRHMKTFSTGFRNISIVGSFSITG